jgi:hypothetical protein
VIVDLYEAVDRMLWAIAAWIAAGAAVVTVVGYGLAALVWCAWTTLRRGVAAAAAWRGLRKPQAPAEATQSPADGFRDAGEPPEASQGPSRPALSRAQTGRKAA